MLHLDKQYGISGNGLKKICDFLGEPGSEMTKQEFVGEPGGRAGQNALRFARHRR
jgi:hypothetical protein